MTNPLLGAGLHGVGAFSSALCYTPQKKTRSWSWQTYWMAQAAVCWLILPVVVAILTTPHLRLVLRDSPSDCDRALVSTGRVLWGRGNRVWSGDPLPWFLHDLCDFRRHFLRAGNASASDDGAATWRIAAANGKRMGFLGDCDCYCRDSGFRHCRKVARHGPGGIDHHGGCGTGRI